MTKRLTLILAALIACLAVGTVAAQAQTSKIGSTLKVKYKGAEPGDPYGNSAFSGKVGPKECAADRKVRIKGLGTEETASNGKFTLTLSGPADPGRYKVSVAAGETEEGDVCKKVKTTLTISKSG